MEDDKKKIIQTLHVTLSRQGERAPWGPICFNLSVNLSDSRLSEWLSQALATETYTLKKEVDKLRPLYPPLRIKRETTPIKWTEQDTRDMLAAVQTDQKRFRWVPKNGYMTRVSFQLLTTQTLDDTPATLLPRTPAPAPKSDENVDGTV